MLNWQSPCHKQLDPAANWSPILKPILFNYKRNRTELPSISTYRVSKHKFSQNLSNQLCNKATRPQSLDVVRFYMARFYIWCKLACLDKLQQWYKRNPDDGWNAQFTSVHHWSMSTVRLCTYIWYSRLRFAGVRGFNQNIHRCDRHNRSYHKTQNLAATCCDTCTTPLSHFWMGTDKRLLKNNMKHEKQKTGASLGRTTNGVWPRQY